MRETILVTGASSFIGEWVVRFLLEKGYNVRGTVRSEAKEAQALNGISKEYHSQISFVHIADIAVDSFDEAVQGVDKIIHVASPCHYNPGDPEKDFLIPAIKGTRGVLQAAHKYNQNHERKISRVVITSSFAANIDYTLGYRPGYTYTEKDWAPETYEDGLAQKDNPVMAYLISKTCAERAVWEIIEKERPQFSIATICEPIVMGPRVDGFKSEQDVNTSNAPIWLLIKSGVDAEVPEIAVPWEIDVRDVARAHIAALERFNEKNRRYLIAGHIWSNQKVVDIIHKSSVIPDSVKQNTPIGNKGQQLPDHYQIDSSTAQQELDIEYTPLKTTIEDLVVQLAELMKTA